jgi:FixJ family two-component response regulator
VTHRAFVVAAVDDDRSVLRSLEALLESADHVVRAFGSAQALLDSGCLPQIDCLISDIDMPGLDGWALARAFAAARPELPVILITGFPERLKQAPSLVARRCFTKPLDGGQLLACVADALRAGHK